MSFLNSFKFISVLAATSLLVAACSDGYSGERFRYKTPQEAWAACNKSAAEDYTFFAGEKFCYQSPILFQQDVPKKDQYIHLVLISKDDYKDRTVLARFYYSELDRDFVYELQNLDYPKSAW